LQDYPKDWLRKFADGVAGKESLDVLPERRVNEALMFAIGASQLENL
jgi:hypothetical protein